MKFFCLLSISVILFANMLTAQTLPTGFSASNIESGWNQPAGAAFSNDGQQLFVWEKGGKVFVCNKNTSGTNYTKQATPVLDISEEVGNWRDFGLLGFALDPNFASNGLIYVLYVVKRHYLLYYGTPSYSPTAPNENNATIGRVTRYKATTNGGNLIADPNSRTILVGETKSTGIPILYESHGVGTLAFAADGTLLVSAGDGASYDLVDQGSAVNTYYAQALSDNIITQAENVGAFRAQLLSSLNGKILRIDPATGNGVSSNPFFSGAAPRSAKSRVWALGFRNPFRFFIKPGTGSTNPAIGDIGEIYVGDVGWNNLEELDIINQPGVNCGWPIFEGLTYMAGYSNLNVVNKDELNPLYGSGGCTQQYFYFRNLIKQATADGLETVYNPCNGSVPIGTGNRFFHHRPSIDWLHAQNGTDARVGTFNGNNASETQINTLGIGNIFNGNCSVAGVWYTGNLFPPSYRNTFFQVDYDAGWIKCFSVDFTDVITKVQNFATNAGGPTCLIQNPLDGTLVYTDIINSRVRRITYGGNQPPVVNLSANKTYGPSPLTVNFTGNTSFDPEGGALTYQWDFGDPGSGSSNSSTLANPSHVFTTSNNNPKQYTVKLTVKDGSNATSTDNIVISVNNTPPVVHITAPVNNATYIVTGRDSVINCIATVTDAEHIPGKLKYAWQTFLRHNNHQHPEPIDTSRITTTTISNIGCNGDFYYWYIELTVTDEAGLSAKDSSKIYPNCTPVNIATINGSVILQGRPPAPNAKWQIPIQVKLYSAGNNMIPVYSFNVTTDQGGNFSIPNIPGGIYTITVKGSHTLQRVKAAYNLVAGTNTVNFGVLLEGDVNNDNVIDPLDVSLLLNSFYKSFGEAGYDARADLNGDNVVDPLDVSLMLNSFYQGGESP